MQSSELYPSAKFVPLSQSQSAATGRKNCTLWIVIIITLALVLSCSSSVLYYFKKYARAAYFSDSAANNESAAIHIEHSVGIPKVWLFTNHKTTPQDFCAESHQLQAVPANLIVQLNNNVDNCMNLALLLHVEGLIRKHDPENLKNIFNDYNRKLSAVAKFEDFVAFMRNLNSNQVKFCLNFLKPVTDLANFQSYFALVDELSIWYNYLHRLGDYLSTYTEQKRRKFYVNVTEVNFYKYTSETQGELFRFVYPFNLTWKKVLEINDVIQEWMKPTKVEVRNGTLIFSNRVMLLSEVNKKMTGDVHTVHVLCSHALYLDEDVTLSGVNLGIVAPRWVFLKRVRINLNGADGPEHEENSKESGKPGNPGGNAGDFFGVGNWNEDYLEVSASGGKGGAGQNGAKGLDGADYTHPDPSFTKPRCLSKINAFQNPYKQTITRYRIFGETGCGGSGSDGGVGGVGGRGGVVILINKSVKIIKGSSGKSGSPGKGGAGGEGGRDGCFYEVFDVNDEVLHRATNVKCTPGNSLPSGKPGKDNRNRKGLMQPGIKSNLSACDCIVNFIRMLDFSKSKNTEAISTLRNLNRYDAGTECVLKKYNAYKKHNNVELYNILKEEINSKFKYLKSVLLIRTLNLKKNIDYFFLDYFNYLKVIEQSIRNTNEQTRELQPIAYLKEKIVAKANKLIQNLKIIKRKLINFDGSGESGEGRKLTCVMLTTMDALFSLVNRTNVEKVRKLDSLLRECLAPDEYVIDANTSLILPQNEKFDVLMIEIKDVGQYLWKLQDALGYLKDSLKLTAGKKKLLKKLVNEVEHLRMLCRFTEWEESAASIFQSLGDTSEENEEGILMRSELTDALIMLQYKLAQDAVQQKTYPFVRQDFHLRGTSNITLLEEVVDRIKGFRESPMPNTICKNKLEAYFGKNSAVGEFYYWPSDDVRNEVEMLFSGAEVRLESSLINRHALDKNFIRLMSLNLEFESSDAKRGKLLRDILLDYKMTITHSGYSHYNWMGDTHVVVSEEMTFEYSFKTRENGEPELYNVLYKKIQDGNIVLSPYTTWTVRLTPINERADYRDLKPYKDQVSLKLTGMGTFIP